MITLDNYKVAEPIDENQKLLDKLNNNFQKGIISEDLYEKSVQQLDALIEKAKVTKYFKREGSPGNYKYYYTEAEFKEAKAGSEKPNSKSDLKVGAKVSFTTHKGKEENGEITHVYPDGKVDIKDSKDFIAQFKPESILGESKESSEKPKGEWQHGSEKKYGQAGYKPKSKMELEDAVRHKYRHSPLSVQKEKVKDEMKRFFPE